MIIKTVQCKLKVAPEQAEIIDRTMIGFADACQYVNDNTPADLSNQIALQALIYRQVREKFDLSANLAIQAIRRVAGNRKKTKPHSYHPSSVSYDSRIFSYRHETETASLTMVGNRCRLRDIPVVLGTYQRELLQGQKPTSATLTRRKNGTYFLGIQIKQEQPEKIETSGVLGVDLGRRDIAYDSTGESFSGEKIERVRDHHAKLRATLQQKAAKGTRSSRRRCRELLKRLSGKEKRFQRQVNHEVSKRIVSKAAMLEQSICLEDLSGIRKSLNRKPRPKVERRKTNSWAFFQLKEFLRYKAEFAGVTVHAIAPAYTSQTCHKCKHIHPTKGKSYRKDKEFSCGNCHWAGDSDYNAACNISQIGGALNHPGGSDYFCDLGLLKSPSIAA